MKFFAVATLTCLMSLGRADIVTHTGSTTPGSTYERLPEDSSALSAVATGFSNTDFGGFSRTIAGPGATMPRAPPETTLAAPQTLVLAWLGMGALGVLRPRRGA